MKKIYSVLILSLISSGAFAQINIDLKDAAIHGGDSVAVCGKVFTSRFFEKDTMTLLNMGAAYPNQMLTVVIRGDARKEFKDAPETFFKDKDVCIFGRITMFNQKPQIVIYHQEQIMEAMKR